MQPLYKDENGIVRFRANAIIRYILDNAASLIDRKQGPGISLNKLLDPNVTKREFSQEDLEQFYQLIGYSLAGYHELSMVSDGSAALASKLARDAGLVTAVGGGCRDNGCEIHTHGKGE